MSDRSQSSSQTSKQSIEQACLWMARLWADNATESDQSACRAWRKASPENEQAWQQVLQMQQRFHLVPDPEVGSKLLRQRKSVSRRQFLSFGGIGIAVGLLSTSYLSPDVITSVDYATRTGEIQKITLDDGTKMYINTSTRVDINSDEHKQKILLHEGEVYIETSSNAVPLTVVSREGEMRPLGTGFSVRVMDKQVRLAVYQGRVQVQPAKSNEKTIVESGLGADFNRDKLIKSHVVDAKDKAWTAHKLAVANMPLDEFVDELSRYRSGILRVSPELPSLTVTGVFSLRDTDRILQQLTEILPIRLQSVTSYWVTLLPA